MRYYDIVLKNIQTGAVVKEWTSHPSGQIDPGALEIVLDLQISGYATPLGDSYVQIWGVALTDIYHAANYGPDADGNPRFEIDIYGGMKAGLPLANPNQNGLLVSGSVWQSFGNWQGTDMTLDFLIRPSAASNTVPKNLIVNWLAGTTLAAALAQTLSAAYPNVKQNINISQNLVLAHDEQGFYPTLEQLAQAVLTTTVDVVSSDYPGVQITLQQGQFYIYDIPSTKNPKVLLFTDLVGQPTWIDAQTIQITTVMRADIQVGNVIKLPQGIIGAPGQVVTQPQTAPNYRNNTAFQGLFIVNAIRHVGDYKQSSGSSWVTIMQAAPVSAS